MNTLFKKSGLLLGLIAFSASAHAQNIPETGSFGLRASFTGQTAIEIPYMFNDNLSLAPTIGFNSTEDQQTYITVGVRPRYYMGPLTNNVAAYFTGILGFSNTSFDNSDSSVTDFNLGVGYGAEYFFSEKFSISADANLNTRFGDSPTNLATSARVSASVYF